MNDRILVINQGNIVHETTAENVDRDRIGRYMIESDVEYRVETVTAS